MINLIAKGHSPLATRPKGFRNKVAKVPRWQKALKSVFDLILIEDLLQADFRKIVGLSGCIHPKFYFNFKIVISA